MQNRGLTWDGNLCYCFVGDSDLYCGSRVLFFDDDAGRDTDSGSGCGSVAEVPYHFGAEVLVVGGACVVDSGGWYLHSF